MNGLSPDRRALSGGLQLAQHLPRNTRRRVQQPPLECRVPAWWHTPERHLADERDEIRTRRRSTVISVDRPDPLSISPGLGTIFKKIRSSAWLIQIQVAPREICEKVKTTPYQ